MAVHTWNGHEIEVESHAVPKLLWLGMNFSVRIDGAEKFSSPKHFEGLRTTVPFKVMDAGNVIHGHIESGRPCSAIHSVYRVFIENELIANGSVRARNWYVTYTILGAGLGAFFISLLTYGT